MQKIKSKDQVIVLTGKDKGKTGVVQQVIKNGTQVSHVVVEGLNLMRKHVRANPQQEQPGGIIQQEAALDVSNVAIVNPATGKADKVGFKYLEGNRKVRVFKSTGEVIDV